MRLQFDGHVAGHTVAGGFACAENDPVSVGHSHIARDAYDQSGFLRHHDVRRMPCRHEIGTQTDIDHFPIGQGLLPERTGSGQLGGQGNRVVHQHIQATLLLLDPLEQRRDLLIVCMVDLHGDAFAAAPVDFSGRLAHRAWERESARRHGSTGYINRSTLVRERQRDPLAHSTTGACNNRNFA